MLKIPSILILLTLACCGCYRSRFPDEPMPYLRNPDPAALRQSLDESLPEIVVTEDTVMIESIVTDQAFLGVLRVDRKAGTFEVQGMSHMGAAAFRIKGDARETHLIYVAEPLKEHREVLINLAEDIRRIYLDMVPVPSARVSVEERSVNYTEKRKEGTLVHVLAGEKVMLREKRLGNWLGTIWRIRYGQYTSSPANLGHAFPGIIVLQNHRFHYQVTIKVRSWEPQTLETPDTP